MIRLRAALMTLLLGLLMGGTAVAKDTVYYYSSDTLHSEVVITDASRNVVERTYYAPYGQVLNRALRDGPGYTGHEEDPESGLVYMQQRYFDPESGRFVSSDPVATTDDGDGFNRYAYVNGNPYRYTDPNGQWAWIDDGIALGVGAVGGLVGQGVEDIASGHLSSRGEYAASALGGAFTAEAALYTVPTMGPAGIAVAGTGGAILTDVGKAIATGKPLSVANVAADAGLSAVASYVPGAKSAAGSLAKQIFTKFERGLIKSVAKKTALKVAGGKAMNDLGATVAGGLAAGAKDGIQDHPDHNDFKCGGSGDIPCGK